MRFPAPAKTPHAVRPAAAGKHPVALHRGFAPGAELEDGLEAELEYEESLEADPS